MARQRLDKTLADYVAIAISPALIMGLVGSLMFFLVEVGYTGEHSARLKWIMACFVLAIVLISRISIEEGTEKATLYGGLLAGAVGLAILRFVEAAPIAWTILAVVWWSAHKLTWDCTLIDETEDATGEGLLQAAGLDPDAEPAEPEQVEHAPRQRRFQTRDLRDERFSRLQTSHLSVEESPKRRAHVPGVWVVYFSLAALPIFGLGQLFVPSEDLATRRYVFWLLGVYVACGLGLLLTTCFLGLRRYLRQRKLQMPSEMTGIWLTAGAATVVALLVAAALIPRPNAEYPLSSLTGTLGSPDREASPYAVLDSSGAEDEDLPGTAPGESGEPGRESNAQGETADGEQDRSEANDQSQEQRGTPPAGKRGSTDGSQGEGNQSSAAESSAGRENNRSSRSRSGGNSKTGDQRSGSGESRQSQGDGRSGERKQQSQSQGEPRSPEQDARGSEAGGEEPSDSAQSDPAEPPAQPSSSFFPELPDVGTFLLVALRWLMNLALAAAILYFAWRYREEIRRWLEELLQSLREFWGRLLGGRSPAAVAAVAEQASPRGPPPFSAFRDPFAGGTHAQSVEELIRYSFEALEAWAHEQGRPRRLEETPLEFAERIAAEVEPGKSVRELGRLYARVCYARHRVGPAALEPVRAFWSEIGASPARSGF